MDAIHGLCMEGLVHQKFYILMKAQSQYAFVNKISSYIQKMYYDCLLK